MMNIFCKCPVRDAQALNARIPSISRMLILAAIVCMATPLHLFAATTVSDQVSVTHTGFGRNRATGVWSATMTVKNTSGSAISGPVQVVMTKLSPNATMVNKTGVWSGSPFITVSAGTLAPGASVSVMIQFTNPSNAFISCEMVTYAGGL
jgi:hypothetical protein